MYGGDRDESGGGGRRGEDITISEIMGLWPSVPVA